MIITWLETSLVAMDALVYIIYKLAGGVVIDWQGNDTTKRVICERQKKTKPGSTSKGLPYWNFVMFS